MNYGFQNEIDFVSFFNDKYLYELDNNSQKFLRGRDWNPRWTWGLYDFRKSCRDDGLQVNCI